MLLREAHLEARLELDRKFMCGLFLLSKLEVGMLRTKVYRADHLKILDEAEGRISATVSSESVDRDGDVIRASGWGLTNFMKHPVLLASHDYHSLRSQIGVWESMEVDGTTMKGTARFFIGKGNAEADWAFELAKEKALAFSVGFIPDMEKATPLAKDSMAAGGMEFAGQELLEVSAVTVPSNPDALQRIVKSNLHPVIAEIVSERLDSKAPEDEPEAPEDEPEAPPFTLEEIAERVLELIDERNGNEDDAADQDDEDDDDETDEQNEERSTNESDEFDPYAVALAAAEAALEQIEEAE